LPTSPRDEEKLIGIVRISFLGWSSDFGLKIRPLLYWAAENPVLKMKQQDKPNARLGGSPECLVELVFIDPNIIEIAKPVISLLNLKEGIGR